MTATWKVASLVALIGSVPWVGSQRRALSCDFLCPIKLWGEAVGRGAKPLVAIKRAKRMDIHVHFGQACAATQIGQIDNKCTSGHDTAHALD